MAGVGNARIKEAIGYQDIGVAIRKSRPIKLHAILIEAISQTNGRLRSNQGWLQLSQDRWASCSCSTSAQARTTRPARPASANWPKLEKTHRREHEAGT